MPRAPGRRRFGPRQHSHPRPWASARLHHRLDLAMVIPGLKALETDPRFAGRVRDALEDIATFVRD